MYCANMESEIGLKTLQRYKKFDILQCRDSNLC